MTRDGRLSMLRAEAAYFEPVPPKPAHKLGDYYPVLGFGFNNYYHFSHDVVMRLQSVADRLPSDIQLLVPEQMSGFQRETMRLAGLDEYPWVTFPIGEMWELENLYVAKPVAKTQIDTPEHFHGYRAAALERYGIPEDGPAKKLFVTRRDDRYWRATNEGEVVTFLEAHGFTTVSPGKLSVREQIAVFSQAGVIVGTGAGMTNMIFSRPGTKVLQFQEPSRVIHSFWTMAAALDFDYHYFFCDVVRNPGAAVADIHVPIEKLESSLAQMTGL